MKCQFATIIVHGRRASFSIKSHNTSMYFYPTGVSTVLVLSSLIMFCKHMIGVLHNVYQCIRLRNSKMYHFRDMTRKRAPQQMSMRTS